MASAPTHISAAASADTAWIFDGQFLRKLERLELLARKVFRGQLRGEHTTARRGRGLEFSDFRRYRPGDDFRHIDWNIYSRLERLFLKLYAAEEDMSLHLLLDASASMGFGEPSKFDHARRLAAALGYIGLVNMDRVSVATVSHGLGPCLAPVKSASQVSTLLAFLNELPCQGPTGLAAALRDYGARARAPGLTVLITDLLDEREVRDGVDALRHRGHEVMLLHLLAEEEIDPPLDGALRLVDAESGAELDVTVDGVLRSLYRKQLDTRLEALEHYCRTRGVEYLRASTAIAFEDVVLKYLRQGALLRVIELAQPWALLSLLALPAILILHMLRPRRRAVLLASTELWRQALRERQRGLGLQKILRNLSLVLLLLFALVAALGLAAPQWLTRTAERDDSVLVLDVSASMQALDGAGTRFDAALEEARALIDALPEGGRMLIMTSARRPVLRTGFEDDRLALQRALERIEPGDEAGRPREALALALSLLRHRDAGRVYFVTDGAFDQDLGPGSPRVHYRRVGGPARNLAITRFDLRPELGREDRFQVLLGVRNYTEQAVSVPASVSLERRVLFTRRLEIEPGGEHTVVLPFDGRVLGVARAQIDVDDDLAADNHAFAAVNVLDALQVLRVGPGNVYLDSVLDAAPRVQVSRVAGLTEAELARQARLHDVVILDRVQAPRLPPGSYLLIDTVPPGLPFTESGSVRNAAVVSQGASALVRNLDLGAVRVDQALRVAVEGRLPGLQRLFGSAETDLALALLDGDLRLVYLGFDLNRSNLPLQAAFPLLFFRSLDWLSPRHGGGAGTHVAAGETVEIRAPAHETELIMRWPSGDARSVALRDGLLRFEDTQRAGIYRYTVSGVRRYFAVNLSDEGESDISPRATLAEPAREARDGEALARVVVPLWPYLTLAALALLALEWLLWCTRRAGA